MARSLSFLHFLPLFWTACAPGVNPHWPQWRGPEHNGTSPAQNPPLHWNLEQNIAWKTALPSWGGGTPAIWGDRVFVTSPDAGDAPEGGPNLLLLCLDRSDGTVLWQRHLDEGNALWRKHNEATPSPVTDGKHVWALSGTGALKAFDMEGSEIWQRHIQQEYGNFGHNWGFGSSPLLIGGLLVVEVLHGTATEQPSYLVAFDAATGAEAWRQERPTDAEGESHDAYSTPVPVRFGGQTRIVVSGGDYVTGHDAATGAEIWRAGGLNPERRGNYRIVGTPAVVDTLIFVPSRRRPLLALRSGGRGDVTQSHLLWKHEDNGAPDVPSPVSDGRYLYLVDDRGRATCLDAADGTVVWGPQRLQQGTVSASPVLAAGRLYIVNEDGVTTVLEAGPRFKLLATNALDGALTLSSPAFAGEQIFLRTATHLYCIGTP